MAPYLSQRALKGLREYQYKAGGYTILDRIHDPVWLAITQRLPMWLAPNLITLTGLIGLMLAYVATIVYTPELSGTAPSWVYLLNALAVFVYVNLDCIDGKQARRTGSSSPLGQLFDHGCDALSVHLTLSCILCSLDAGHDWISVGGAFCIMVPWMLAHWEEYHTGQMLYGNGYFGVIEANYALVATHLATFFFGPKLWWTPLPLAVRSALFQLTGLPAMNDLVLRNLLSVLICASGLVTALGNLTRVLGVPDCSAALTPKERGHKQLGRRNAVLHLLGLLALFVLGFGFQTSVPLPLAPGMARAVTTTFGVIYALVASQLIVAHMCKEPLALPWQPMLLMAAVWANNHLLVMDAFTLCWLANAVSVVAYLHYSLNVVNEICVFLGIKCLVITPKIAK